MLAQKYFTKKSLQVVLVTLVLVAVFIYLKEVWSKKHSLGMNVYYNTLTSCMDERFYIIDKLTKEQVVTEIKKGDIVKFYSPKDVSEVYKKQVEMLKVVAAVEGDQIEIKNLDVFINNEKVSERSLFMLLKLRDNGFGHIAKETEKYTLKKGEFFAMGTNPENSFDSRFWGVASLDDVTGKVTWKGVTWL